MSVAENNPWPHIGQMFLEQGRINRDQLESALTAQRDTGERLGEILVARGYISRVDLATAIGAQWAWQEQSQDGEALAEPTVSWEARPPAPVAAPPVAAPPVAAPPAAVPVEPMVAQPVVAEPVAVDLVEANYASSAWPEIESAPPAPPVAAAVDHTDLWPAPTPAPLEQPTEIVYAPPVAEAPAPLPPPPTTWPPAAELVTPELVPEVVVPEAVPQEPVFQEAVAQEPALRLAPAEGDERVLGDLQLRLRSVYESLAASESRLGTLESLVRELTYANAALKTQVDAQAQDLESQRSLAAKQQAQLTNVAHALLG